MLRLTHGSLLTPQDASLNPDLCDHALVSPSLARYRRLKFIYLDPMNNKIKLLPMNAAKMPRSLHRFS